MSETGLKSFVKGIARTSLLASLTKALRWKRYLEKTEKMLMSGDDGRVEKVYDIVNCGPRNRFCTPFAVAHNCLGLGYGCGQKKFVLLAKLLAGIEVTPEDAATIVQDFRQSNPGIVALWKKLERKIRVAGAKEDDLCTYILHSGRPLNYWKPKFRVPSNQQSPQLMAMFARGDKSSYRKIYGGLLTENVIQGLCRDVLRDAWINLDKHGYRVLWSVHDELIVELPEDADVKEAEQVMLDAPEWARFIPLAVESQVSQHYVK
jgi:DNA polymerase bacteriophage-type